MTVKFCIVFALVFRIVIVHGDFDRFGGVRWYISTTETEIEKRLDITTDCDQLAIYYDIYGKLNNAVLKITGFKDIQKQYQLSEDRQCLEEYGYGTYG